MAQLIPPFDRFLVRVLSPWMGEVRALHELRQIKEISRFALMFAALVLGPLLVLVVLSLRNLDAEELRFDADLKTRADAATTDVEHELERQLKVFETNVVLRLAEGNITVDDLRQEAPFVQGLFRFSDDGELLAPIVVQPEIPAPPTPRYRTLQQEALKAGQAEAWSAAAEAWSAASELRVNRELAATARLRSAQAMIRAGERSDAEDELTEVSLVYPLERTELGFRISEVARLELGVLWLQDDPNRGERELRNLVEEIVTSPTGMETDGDAALAKRTLEILDGIAPPPWVRQNQARLERALQQLEWSQEVIDEAELFADNAPPTPVAFQYGAGVSALWAATRFRDQIWVFALDVNGLVHQLQIEARRVERVYRDLSLNLVLMDEPGPREGLLVRRSLAPRLPQIAVAVRAADPAQLRAERSNRRRQRNIVAIIAFLTAFLGVFVATRLVSRELESARLRTDFAANVSHELRSPITQIRLKAESLQFGLTRGPADEQEHYAAIVRESERLSRLVDNVLDFAAIERGAKKYVLRPTPLDRVLINAIQAADSAIQNAGLELSISFPDHLPVVAADEHALGQVMINLISNAIKYGGSGGWLGLSVELDDESVHIEVSDKGIGMEPEDAEHVFDHFYRSRDPEVRKKRGTGIGLAIVRYIVVAHQGSVSVDSAPGKGSTFTVSLPLTDEEQ